MILQEVLDKTIRFFKEKNLDSPRLDAELLISKAMGIRRIDLYLKFDQPMGEPELTRCRDFVRRRSIGEPVAYILGEKDFFGHSFQVDSRVLIPRPETELLVEAAIVELSNGHIAKKKAVTLEWTSIASTQPAIETASNEGEASAAPANDSAKFSRLNEPLRVLDLGCGSGCLGLSVLANLPNGRLTAVDVSQEALEVTKANAARMGLADRCEFIKADASAFDFGSRRFDVVVANPPYIAKNDPRLQPEVARFEPNLALYAEDEGFALIKNWSSHAIRAMTENAWIGFEFGAGQEQKASAHFKSLGLQDVRIINDLAGLPRHVVGRKGNTNG